MKTKIFLVIILSMAVLEVKFDLKKPAISLLTLENIEALASIEIDKPYTCSGVGTVDCPIKGVKVKNIYIGYNLESYN